MEAVLEGLGCLNLNKSLININAKLTQVTGKYGTFQFLLVVYSFTFEDIKF